MAPDNVESPKPSLRPSRYRLGERLGLGGMGEVLLAHDQQIGRDVAIKRLRSAEPTDREVKRFVREARIQGRLEHPAIPPVHELGQGTDGLPYFAMKRLAGTTLQAILDAPEPRFTRQRLLRAFAEVCLAVEFAHVHGVIHRDLKPDNIMLGEFGEVYVLDWGVAKILDEENPFDDIAYDGLATRGAVGTQGYQAPEQAAEAPDLDARADVFSLGRVLNQILAAYPEPPPELVAVVAKASRERDARLARARELAELVQGYLDGDRDLALRKKLADDHLERARGAFAAGDSEELRSTAIREAGSALALAPNHTGAAELVGRLMLEPPRVVPTQVEDALRTENSRRAKAFGRATFVSFVVAITTVPVGLHLGSTAAMAWLCGGLAVGALVSLRTALGALTPLGVFVGANALWIAILGHIYSPFFVSPVLIVFLMLCFAWHRSMAIRRHAIFAWLGMIVTVLAPLVAERLDWLPHTFDPEPGGGVFLHPPGIVQGEYWSIAGSVWVVLIISAAALVAHLIARAELAMRRSIQVQAWTLRQLVPDQRGAA